MGMSIDKAIEHGKEQLEIFGGEHKEFIEISIDTMRKYQKIEEILKEPCIIPDGCYLMLKKIREVMKNGNDDN